MLTFFLLTFAATWSCFITVGMMSSIDGGVSPSAGFPGFLILLGTFSPAIVALSLTARAAGSSGTRALLSRLFEWRVGVRWYVFAIGYMAAIKLAVAVAHRVLTGGWPRFGHEAWYIILAATVVSTVIGGQAGEEIGWRGYALPRLSDRFGLARASVILGVIWACWHLPLFFIPGADTYRQSFFVYLLSVTALSVAIAWLYGHTDGSLLPAMLMHSAVNQSKDIVPSAAAAAASPFTLSASPVAWLTVAFLWIAASYFLVRMLRLPGRCQGAGRSRGRPAHERQGRTGDAARLGRVLQ